jgi:hypothetical protein
MVWNHHGTNLGGGTRLDVTEGCGFRIVRSTESVKCELTRSGADSSAFSKSSRQKEALPRNLFRQGAIRGWLISL